MLLSSPVFILHWQRAIIRTEALTAAEKAIAMALALRINGKSGKAWPSLERLAADACQSASVAARAISKLIKLGYITAQRTGRTSIYRLRHVSSGNSDMPVAATERAKEQCKAFSSPAESDIATSEAVPDVDPMPSPAPALETAQIGAQAVEDHIQDAVEDDAAKVIEALNDQTGTRHPTDRPTATRKLIQKRLDSGITAEDMALVIAYCSVNWSRKEWATAHALFRDSARFESLLQAAQASRPAGRSGPKLRLPITYIEAHKRADEDLEAADARLLFECRTGQRRPPPRQQQAA